MSVGVRRTMRRPLSAVNKLRENLMKLTQLLAVSAALVAAESQAATVLVSHDRVVFQDAIVGGYTVETFTDASHFPIASGVLNSETETSVDNGPAIHVGDIQPGATYSTPVGPGYFFNIDAGGGFQGGFLDGFYSGLSNRVLTVTFDQGVSAFGFDANQLTPNLNVELLFADQSSAQYSFIVGGYGFYGFSALDTKIVGAKIGGQGNGTFAFAVDNVTFSEVAAVPEPEAYALLLAGLMVVGAVARRRA